MRYPSKAAWAAAKAQELRREADSLSYVPSADWRGIRARGKARRYLLEEACRMEAVATRLQALGR